MKRLCAFLLLWPTFLFAQDLAQIERNLAAIGIPVGTVDGIADTNTQNAVIRFQYDFGFPVTGQLSLSEVQALQNAATFSAQPGPFVVREVREQTETETRMWGHSFIRYPSTVYANGADYMVRRGGFQYNAANRNLADSFKARLTKRSPEERRAWQARAVSLSVATPSVLDDAILTLTTHSTEPRPFDDPIWVEANRKALEVLIEQANASPSEPALVHVLAKGLSILFPTHSLCKSPKIRAIFEGLALQAAQIIDRAPTEGIYKASGLSATLQCISRDAEDSVHQMLVRASQGYDPKVVANQMLNRARAADERADYPVAQFSFLNTFDALLNRVVTQSDNVSSDLGEITVLPNDIAAVHRADLEPQSRMLAEAFLQSVIARGTADRTGSRAAQGGFYFFNRGIAQALIETQQFDLLRRHGQFFSEGKSEWGSAIEVLEVLLRRELLSDVLDLAPTLLGEMLKAGPTPAALDVALLHANAAAQFGSFDVAEAAVVQSASLAQTLGALPKVDGQIKAIRSVLETDRARQEGPAALLIQQINTYYGNSGDCHEPAQANPPRYWPLLDLVPFLTDASVRKDLLDAKILDRIVACNPKGVNNTQEVRLLCGLAAVAGRQDILKWYWAPVFQNEKNWQIDVLGRGCLLSMAAVGHAKDFQPLLPFIQKSDRMKEIAFAFADKQTRTTQLAQISADYSNDTFSMGDKELRMLEAPTDRVNRIKRLGDYASAMAASYGNIGMQVEDEAVLLENAYGYSALGLHGIAEGQLFAFSKVDATLFGGESIESLRAQLLDPNAIRERLSYARIYIAAGRADDADAALAPIVRLAVQQMSGSTDDPLPGTVEQWSQRLRDLFSTFLELQFENLNAGPDYPTLFAVQQYLQLSQSTASSSVLEQRLNSSDPAIARQYQDTQRALRRALDQPVDNSAEISELSQRLQSIAFQLPEDDAARQSHQIGVIRSLKDVVLKLGNEQASMVVMSQLDDVLILTYLDGSSATARKFDLGIDDTARMVKSFRDNIILSTNDTDRFSRNEAKNLYRTIVGWGHANKAAPNDLRLVADGPLATLPYAALIGDDEEWLGARMRLQLSPSVARAISARDAQGKRNEGFVGIGDPNLTIGDITKRKDLIGQMSNLPELPETAQELIFMALAFNANPTESVFTRNDATESSLRALSDKGSLRDLRVLALATHGLLSTEAGQINSAGLILSLPVSDGFDGILTASEIYSYDIKAELVLLSACNTGTPGADQSLSELASAFLYAGADSLMLTHWEIDSGAAVELVKWIALHQREEIDATYPHSLQEAIVSILNNPDLSEFHHPRFWASHFVLQ